jgi:hypothetical protein
MNAAVGRLAANTATIREMENAQVRSATVAKQEAERAIVDNAIHFSNGLYVIGFTNSEVELVSLSAFGSSLLHKTKDYESLVLVRRAQNLARTYVAELPTYGLNDFTIGTYGICINSFNAPVVVPMSMIGADERKTVVLHSLFATLDSTLYDRLARLMVLCKMSNINSHGKYLILNLADLSARYRTKTTVGKGA